MILEVIFITNWGHWIYLSKLKGCPQFVIQTSNILDFPEEIEQLEDEDYVQL